MSSLFDALKTNVKGVASDYHEYSQKKKFEKEKQNFDSLSEKDQETSFRVDKIIAITSELYPHKNYEVIGDAFGVFVASKNAFSDIGASFKNLVGGELGGYSKMNIAAKEEAVKRMKADAVSKGADAIIAMRLNQSASGIGNSDNMLTFSAYGTAIKFLK
ncbi:heavy metal-binding domain-containing protein [Limosilactobacillus sp. RRLNB_1_1]|uniref:Heavy metal-binding domain-containing protein n=1 Tax=Limosilactobacillus albertensis TaxID=2759752 RepID=A0A7W3Y8I2_9LACO|nr:heavy metal-binding domain-containing protein [Limosilactobacillus albertensis]MBB1069701.1 heavy metal-binding domain-containing protein [Limosilactobacillus albertensis]MCD7117837.1 heavy metal-binding domain-containing protein [Limosilactobacillus albertensis]MCD7128453.1 heavy metal-binding domain-containing protein [Limosilactobacillus albertensis]